MKAPLSEFDRATNNEMLSRDGVMGHLIWSLGNEINQQILYVALAAGLLLLTATVTSFPPTLIIF